MPVFAVVAWVAMPQKPAVAGAIEQSKACWPCEIRFGCDEGPG